MPLIRYDKYYTRAAVQADPSCYYLFGDNVQRKGTGPRSGQALIRGLPNALGIVVKWRPSNDGDAFFRDTDWREIKPLVDKDLNILYGILKDGKTVYYPSDGIGTGRANLPVFAPRVYAYISKCLTKLEQRFNDTE